MSFKIIVGKKLAAQHQSKSGLENKYASPDFIIQGDSDLHLIKEKGEVRAFVLGRIIGKRTELGMERVDLAHSDVKRLLCSQHIETCITMLEGRFIIVRFDKDGSFEIGCDRYGQMDLYYQKIEDGIVFATDLSMLPFRNSTVKYDPVSVAHSIYIYGFRPAKRHTIYSGVRRLGVGETVRWKDKKITFQQAPPTIIPTNNEYGQQELSKYSEILLSAVEQRSSSNGNVVFLSSGWDSTAILACLVKLHGATKVRAVIGRMNYSERSGYINPFEIDRAKKVADYFGVKLEVVEFDYVNRGPELAEYLQPFLRSHMFSGMSLFHWARLSEHLSKTSNGEALFAGEISDGVHNFGFSQFASILDHPDLGFREYADKMASYLFGPTFLKSMQDGKSQSDIVYNLFRQRAQDGIFDEVSNDPIGCRRQLFVSLFLRDRRVPLWSLNNTNIMTEEGRRRYSEEMEAEYINQPALEATPETMYSWYTHLYNSFHWQGGTVSTLPYIADEYGLEMNLPFYDSRLHEFLAATPESWGRGLELRPTKYPLKYMLEHCIDYPFHLQVGPHSYLYDIDPNFNHAGEFIYKSSFSPQIKETIRRRDYRELLTPGFFNCEYFDQIVDNYLAGREIVSERNDLSVLAFLSLTGWYGMK